MPEDNKKKDQGVTVRIPLWLADALEEELKSRPRPRPTRGDLLGDAWKAWKGTVAKESDDPELDRVRYILEHSRLLAGFRGSIELYFGDAKQNPRDKSKRKVG